MEVSTPDVSVMTYHELPFVIYNSLGLARKPATILSGLGDHSFHIPLLPILLTKLDFCIHRDIDMAIGSQMTLKS